MEGKGGLTRGTTGIGSLIADQEPYIEEEKRYQAWLKSPDVKSGISDIKEKLESEDTGGIFKISYRHKSVIYVKGREEDAKEMARYVSDKLGIDFHIEEKWVPPESQESDSGVTFDDIERAMSK